MIALFRVIAGSHPKRRAAYPALLPCPRCTTPLTPTQDLQHTTRFSYYRCRYSHGRFTPYAQFLLEKSFIRPLDPQELGRLRVSVATVSCVSCGAPVPLDREPVCPYCGAPVMLLDPDAVAKALERLDAAEARRTAAQPLGGEAVIAIANVERELARNRRAFEGESGVDLIGAGFHALFTLLAR
jgi:DNA-directed RNA polymerase subunit RPC12/RpoP